MLGLLKVNHGPDKEREFPLRRGRVEIIGRGQTATIRLCDPQVSRYHCRLQYDGDKVLLSDSGSSSGIFVNGERVSRHELQTGDVIVLGETQISFQWADIDEKSTEAFYSPDTP